MAYQMTGEKDNKVWESSLDLSLDKGSMFEERTESKHCLCILYKKSLVQWKKTSNLYIFPISNSLW